MKGEAILTVDLNEEEGVSVDPRVRRLTMAS